MGKGASKLAGKISKKHIMVHGAGELLDKATTYTMDEFGNMDFHDTEDVAASLISIWRTFKSFMAKSQEVKTNQWKLYVTYLL